MDTTLESLKSNYLFIVEDYRRTSKNIGEPQKPPAENEVRVSHSKINVYVDTCVKLLEEKNHNNIVIVGKGQYVSKAVTVIEMVKRKMKGTLHQYTQLGSVSVTEKWDAANDKELDSIEVDKKIPIIIIHLSKNELPELEATAGYQAPTGDDFFD